MPGEDNEAVQAAQDTASPAWSPEQYKTEEQRQDDVGYRTL